MTWEELVKKAKEFGYELDNEEVYIDGRCVKEYRHRLQAVIYLAMKGCLYRARGLYWLSSNTEIKEKNYDNI